MTARSFARSLVALLPAPLSRRLLFFHRFHRFPSMRSPVTFQEKLNVRVLRDRRWILVVASSKVLSKEFVRSLNVPGLCVPQTFWHGTDLCELEGVQFSRGWVLKPSHRSGGVQLGDAGIFRMVAVEASVDDLLAEREYRESKLWAYREAPRELIMEERLGERGDDLMDYKFFVFRGRVAMIQVDQGRFGNHARVLYTPEWVARPETFGVPRGTPGPAPEELASMVQIAASLGEKFDFVRVDLYLVDGSVYFGELTMYPGGGLSPWPESLDTELGAQWRLPSGEELQSCSPFGCDGEASQ